ncbi:MAG: hypothetical protein ACD_55C00036G0001, partial [uncultured bacterium]
MAPQAHDAEGEAGVLLGDLAGDVDAPHCYHRVGGGDLAVLLLGDGVAVDLRMVLVLLVERAEGVVGADLDQVQPDGEHEVLVDPEPVLVRGNVALRLLQAVQKGLLHTVFRDPLGELQRAAGVIDHLHRLQPRELVEEPAAARVHQHGMTLHLQKLQRGDLFRGVEVLLRVLGQEAFRPLHFPVQDHLDVSVSRLPRVLEEFRPLPREALRQAVPQPV